MFQKLQANANYYNSVEHKVIFTQNVGHWYRQLISLSLRMLAPIYSTTAIGPVAVMYERKYFTAFYIRYVNMKDATRVCLCSVRLVN
jgi:hypothetical protein